MADDSQTLRAIDWRQVLPFTNLFRTFRIAVHPSKLILALAALLLLYIGGHILDGIWSDRHTAMYREIDRYAEFRSASDHTGSFADTALAYREGAAETYAQLLLQYDLVASPDLAERQRVALEWAHAGKEKHELKRRIIDARNKSVASAAALRDAALAAAKGKSDDARDRAERDAQAAYNKAVRVAFESRHLEAHAVDHLLPTGNFIEFFTYETRQVNNIVGGVLTGNWLGSSPSPRTEQVLTLPDVRPGVVRSAVNFISVGPGWLLTQHPLYFILFSAMFLLIWAVFGGAICRIAAVHIARDEKISVRQALQFSVSKVLSFVFAPLIPLFSLIAVGLVVAAGGLLFYVPVIGPWIASALLVLGLVAGLIMALVSLGTVGGFNLMYPTIGVEGSDSFDAISRSFSYVFARPWRMLFYTLVAVVYGALTFLFVRFFIWFVLYLTHSFLSLWLHGQPGQYFPEMWPSPTFMSMPYDINYTGLAWSEELAAGVMSIWVYLLISLLGAYGISYYFSANTLIYYLMRREVDATDLEDVYVEEMDDEFASESANSAAPASGAVPVAVPLSAATPAKAAETPSESRATSAILSTMPSTNAPAPDPGPSDAPAGGISGAAGSSIQPGVTHSYTAPTVDAPATNTPTVDTPAADGAIPDPASPERRDDPPTVIK